MISQQLLTTLEQAHQEIPVRALRNPGRIVQDLAETGEVGRITSNGHLIAWLVPATEEQRIREELVMSGKLIPGRPGGLANRNPMGPAEGGRPLSEILADLRAEETA